MENTYPIMLGADSIGEAHVKEKGLYYHIRCTCRLSGQTVYRVSVVCEDRQENLGILVPEGDCFRAQSRVAVSKLGVGQLRFYAVPKHEPMDKTFVPIQPEEPFAYISRLDQAYLRKRNGRLELELAEKQISRP